MRMVMQSIDLADTITISVQQEPGLCLTADLPFLPKGSGNIAAKAAARFFEQTRLPVPGLAIDIQKRIPVCAGMAGGSSDGAAVLRLLRRNCSPELCRERLTDLPDLPCCWLVVCKPPCSVSTPELFALVRVKRLRFHPRTDEMLSALERGDLEGVARRLYNGCEDVLPRRYSQVFEIKSRLLELGAMAASMTGSGPAVFGLFRDKGAAENAAEALSIVFPSTFFCAPTERTV